MKKALFFYLFLFFSVIKAEKNIVTSIIIPCHYKHAQHLYALLQMFEHQTELPSEIVISMSEVHRVPGAILEALYNELWSFPVIIVTSRQKLYAGQNRNIACQRAKGNVFICQDADDIPHPRRVEIIKYFFANYTIDHLMHCWTKIENDFVAFVNSHIDITQIKFVNLKQFKDTWKIGWYLTNGNVAISRAVFNKINWTSMPRGQDVAFNASVYSHFPNRIVINAPLLGYRSFLSSTREFFLEKPCDINQSVKYRPEIFIQEEEQLIEKCIG